MPSSVGDYQCGETFFYDDSEDAYDFYTMDNAIPRFGTSGTILRGNIKTIKDTVVTFNGKLPHGTMPFRGERFALICFSVGTTMYDLTPSLHTTI